MPYENEHAARLRSPNLFDDKTYRRTSGGKAVLPGSGLIEIPSSISIIWGKLKTANKPSDNPLVQALRFPTKNWTSQQARKWLTDKKVKYISFESATKEQKSEFSMEDKRKPLLLFAPIYDFVAAEFIDKMNDIPENEDMDMWVNSPGGRVFAGWSIIGAMQKRTGKNNVCILGHAASMSVFFALFADYAEALEVTQFMIHRADGYVDTPEDQAFLDKINKDLRKKMEERLNMDVFEEVTGKTMNQIFDPKQRVDVWIDAKQAKKIGLIDKIKKFDQKELKAYNEFVAFADLSQRSEDHTQRSDYYQEPEADYFNNNQKFNKMTIDELKMQHPELFAEVEKLGIEAGKKAEQIRVKSWLAYLGIDKENVISAIKEGKEFTTDVISEMAVKMHAEATKEKAEADNPGAVNTDKPDDKTAQQKEVESFENEVKEGVKLITV